MFERLYYSNAYAKYAIICVIIDGVLENIHLRYTNPDEFKNKLELFGLKHSNFKYITIKKLENEYNNAIMTIYSF